MSGSRWPEENERCQRSLEQLSSWTLAQDTDKPKFAEHYHGSTDITFPEGTRGKYTRDSMPLSATQYALVDLACSVSHPEVPDAVRNAPDRRRKPVEPALPLFVLYRSTVGGSTGHRSAQASWRRDDGEGRDGGGDADRGRGRNGQTRQTDE